ncbi:MAG: hypothetical protein U1F07_16400 [Rubrivivax sp.]
MARIARCSSRPTGAASGLQQQVGQMAAQDQRDAVVGPLMRADPAIASRKACSAWAKRPIDCQTSAVSAPIVTIASARSAPRRRASA